MNKMESFYLKLQVKPASIIRLLLLFGFIVLNALSIVAQERLLQGRIYETGTGDPLPGVSIVIKGAGQGTITDAHGNFSLAVASGVSLEISYIGFIKQEVLISNQTMIEIALKPDVFEMEDFVVVGFGSQKKVNLTGSVGIIDAAQIEARPVQNAAQALQGLVTGLNITQSNGTLDDKPSINIRGEGNLGGSESDPLVLIDGMEGDINAINPQDIESISVLKDAAASSIYGSRAPFGVILVTTKKGTKGKAKFNYNNNFRWSTPMAVPDMLDSYEFALYFNDALINGNSSPHFSEEHLQRIKDYQTGTLKESVPEGDNGQWADGYDHGNANTDWYKEIYKKAAFAQEHNISISGGTDAINYYVSGNFLGQDGLMKLNQDTHNRYTATAKIGAKLNSWTTLNYTSRFVRTENERPATLGDGLYQNLARQGWPTLPLYDPNGYLYSSPSPALGLRDRGQDKYQKDLLSQQIQVVLEPVKGWKTIGEFNYRKEDVFSDWQNYVTYNHDVDGNPVAYSKSSAVSEFASRGNYANTNIYSEYITSFNKVHNFKIMGGFQSEEQKYRQFNAQKDGVIVNDLQGLNNTSGTAYDGEVVEPSVNGLYYDWSTAGFFGRINYNYMEKYLIEVNMRYDASSRFRGDIRWELFPSVSLGWNIARESFWENNLDKISTFKLRASYGELGNQNIGYLDGQSTMNYYPTYSVITLNDGGGRDWLIDGRKPNTSWAPAPVSSSLAWETIKTFDVGIDIAALNNRLSFTADYYIRKTADMVGPAPTLPVTYGYSVPETNNTDLETQGWEFDITWKDRLENGLGYSVSFLLSDHRTKVTRYHNPTGGLGSYRSSQYLGEIWGYETVGIAKTSDEMVDHLSSLPNGGQDAVGSQWDAGDIMYADLNNDGKIDEGANTFNDSGDRKIIGNSSSRFPFAIDLSMDWKGFDFRAFFQGVGKKDYSSGSYYFWGAHSWGKWWSTGFEQHLDYFRPEDYSNNEVFGANVDAYYPRPLFGNDKNQKTQTGYLQNASYIRLKNLQLGYTLPAKFTKKFGCSKLRIFVSGENLWTFTKLSEIFDPETVGTGSWVNSGSVYPLSSVFSGGLSINF